MHPQLQTHEHTDMSASYCLFVYIGKPLNSVCCAYYEDLPKQELSPHSAHTEEQADWLEMQQVTAAMGLVKKLPGRQGPPDPPPVLSAGWAAAAGKRGRDQTGRREEQGWEDRREGRGGELSRWSRESRRKAQRDIAASQHSDNHLAIIRERARQRDKEKIKQETHRRQNRGRWISTMGRWYHWWNLKVGAPYVTLWCFFKSYLTHLSRVSHMNLIILMADD